MHVDRIIEFGKHRGRTWRWVAQTEPSYLCWLLSRPFSAGMPELRRSARDALMEVWQQEVNVERFGDLA